MANKKVLLLDVDEVIVFSGFLEAVNEFMHTDYEIDDFTDYYIDEVVIPKERMPEFNNFLRNRNMYEKQNLLPNAVEVIKKLNEKYDIYLLSSCVNFFDVDGSGRNFADKYNFLIKTLPFINPGHIILTSAKHLFKADVQIDDRVNNLEHDIPLKILFPSYHNKEFTDEELKEKNIIRIGTNWRTAWKDIEKHLL